MKKLISLMLALVLLISIASVPAVADTTEDIPYAYLMYADASWTNQYWGADDGSGVKAVNADVTGPGNTRSALTSPGPRMVRRRA